LTANVVAVVPLNLTAVAPVRFVPSISTSVPTGPEVGENDVTVGTLPVTVTVAEAVVPLYAAVKVIVPVALPSVIWNCVT
jgi:hypothetical protein